MKNNKLGSMTKRHADKNARNKELVKNLEHMGQRSMANTFARAYYKRIARALELWKEWARSDKHRKDLLRRTVNHYLKANGQYLMAVFANWKAKSKINDARNHIRELGH